MIATGARATVPPIPGSELAIISDDILDLPELPAKLAIVGGGYIALEFAGIYNNFGSETHVFYRQVRSAAGSAMTLDRSIMLRSRSPFPMGLDQKLLRGSIV